MQLTCEDLTPIDAVTGEQLDEILSSDVFGKYTILSQSDSAFIQAASDWQPTDECRAFMKLNDSDPWILEYRDGDSDAHFRAAAYVTLAAVIRTFQSYLRGDQEWRTDFNWKPVTM
jgi:trehalose-6-phosphatase